MRGKNVIAGLLVVLFSVALAVGITFIVASGNSLDLTIQTPVKTAQIASTAAIGQPLNPNGSPTPLPTENCTFPIDVWVKYPSAWKIEIYRIGDRTYSKKEMLDLLRGKSSDVRGRLLTEIFVVVLNQRNGADATNIRAAFSEAIDWLVAFPPGSTPSDGDLQKANSIATTLSSFNEGSLGPQTCQFDLAPAVPNQQSGGSDVFTPTGTLTITSTRIFRIYPSETPQPRESDRKAHTRVPPTLAPPTAVPPTPTSDLPTRVPTQPVPTDPPPPTDIPPTDVPPTVGVTRPPATSVPATAVPATSAAPTAAPPTSPPPTVRPTDPPRPTDVSPTKPPKKTPKPFRINPVVSVYEINHTY